MFSFQIQSLEFSRQSDLPARHSSQTSAMGGMTRVDTDSLKDFLLTHVPLVDCSMLPPQLIGCIMYTRKAREVHYVAEKLGGSL